VVIVLVMVATAAWMADWFGSGGLPRQMILADTGLTGPPLFVELTRVLTTARKP
jgi:hypothetical protein